MPDRGATAPNPHSPFDPGDKTRAYRFVIARTPVAGQRSRNRGATKTDRIAAAVLRAAGMEPAGGGRGHYNPERTRRLMDDVKTLARVYLRSQGAHETAGPGGWLRAPIAVVLDVFLPPPQNMPHLHQLAEPFLVGGFGEGGRSWGGDWDNFAKPICDALNGVFWRDDREISDGRVRKYWKPASRAEPFYILWARERLPGTYFDPFGEG